MSEAARQVWAAATRAALLLTIAGQAWGQELPFDIDETFAASSLDPALTQDVDAVLRLEVLRFEVHDPGRATRTVRRAVTILRPEGRAHGSIRIFYDGRQRRLRRLTGRVIDAQGAVVRTLDKDDQEDVSAIDGFSLYDDERVRVAGLFHDAYPYTVEFAYELQHDGLITWPTWYPQEPRMSVAFGRFDLVTPADMKARYAVRGVLLVPEILEEGKRTTLRWQIRDVPAVEIEPFGPAWEEQVLAVYTAPETFELEGTRGDMRSWQAFGRWYHALNAGRAALPPEAKFDVQRLTARIDDPRERARQLFAYMQERTRYVSIQLGLGGWQTFDATYVHERGYGDCKALTNYMRGLLAEAGISSYPALVYAGDAVPDVLPDFPSNQFNHVILYVDVGDGDGIWLENTDHTMPFGHLGTFTEDRYALLVKPEGGEVVRTPKSQPDQNVRVLRATVQLASSGAARLQIATRFTGNQRDDVRRQLADRSGRERDRWLLDYLDVRSAQVASSGPSVLEEPDSDLALSVTVDAPRYAARTGTRLFIPLSFLHRETDIPPATDARLHSVAFFPYAFVRADTIRYELPEGFAVEALPDPLAIDVPTLRFSARADIGPDGVLLYTRRIEVTDPVLPAEYYDDLRDALLRIARAHRSKAVLVAQ